MTKTLFDLAMNPIDEQSGRRHIDVQEYLLTSYLYFTDFDDPDGDHANPDIDDFDPENTHKELIDPEKPRVRDGPDKRTEKIGVGLIKPAMGVLFPDMYTLRLTGSASENVTVLRSHYETRAREFFGKDQFREYVGRNELDFMVVIDLAEMIEGKPDIQDIEGCPGFLRVELKGEINERYSHFEHEKDSKRYLSGDSMILDVEKHLTSYWEELSLKETNPKLKKCTVYRDRNGPAIRITVKNDVPEQVEKDGTNSKTDDPDPEEIDCVVAIKLPSWPTQAKEWLERKRVWPSPQKVEQLMSKGAMAVVKAPQGGDPKCDWRLSFSYTEYALVSDREAPCRQQAYRIFKYIIKNHVIPSVAPKSTELPAGLSSYHLKTILLWMSERLPPEYWGWENLSHCYLGEFIF